MKRYRLQQARQSIGKTQTHIADFLDLTPNAYQAIELGTRGTTQKNWLKLFNLFSQRYPLDKLMELSDTLPDTDNEKNPPADCVQQAGDGGPSGHLKKFNWPHSTTTGGRL